MNIYKFLEKIAIKNYPNQKRYFIITLISIILIVLSMFGLTYSPIFHPILLCLVFPILWSWGMLMISGWYHPEKGAFSRKDNKFIIWYNKMTKPFATFMIIIWFTLAPISLVQQIIRSIIIIIKINT